MTREKLNAYIMALYIFQFGFLQPVASYAGSQWPIAAFSLGLLFLALINNRFKIKLYVLGILIAVSFVFIINGLINYDRFWQIGAIFSEYAVKSFSAVIIASFDVRGKDLYKSFLTLAVVNFFALAFSPFVDSFNIGYMRFGYAMLPSVLMFLYASVLTRKIRWMALFLASFSLMFVFGNRGTFIAFAIFVFLILLLLQELKLKTRITILVSGALAALALLYFRLAERMFDYVINTLGITSYSLNKIQLMFAEGLAAASSARDRIYARMIEIIRENIWLGSGIGITQQELGFTAHNLFLQILIETGIIGLMVWLLVWSFGGNKYYCIYRWGDNDIWKIVTLVASCAVGRLLVSSDLWLRPEYWFVLSLLFGYLIVDNLKEKTPSGKDGAA